MIIANYAPRWLSIISYPTRAHGIIVKYSQMFKTASVVKNIWRIINTIASIWYVDMCGYLSLDITCSSKLTVFLELRSRKTVRFSEQIMSADEYPDIFRAKWRLLFIYCVLSIAISKLLFNCHGHVSMNTLVMLDSF